jgi:hypothetical protein
VLYSDAWQRVTNESDGARYSLALEGLMFRFNSDG